MRAEIVIEDTPDGVRLNGTFLRNGVTDHAVDSLTCMIVAQLQQRLAYDQAIHILQVDDVEPTDHAPH